MKASVDVTDECDCDAGKTACHVRHLSPEDIERHFDLLVVFGGHAETDFRSEFLAKRSAVLAKAVRLKQVINPRILTHNQVGYHPMELK